MNVSWWTRTAAGAVTAAALAMGCSDSDPAPGGDPGNGDCRNVEDGDRVLVRCSVQADATWSADRTWVLEDLIFVENGAVLTIEPGTTILGEDRSALIVTATGRLEASGTRTAPIVFTSSKAPGTRRSGDWGGVAMLGRAPINIPSGQLEGIESSDARGQYGGDDPEHNCGTLRYARIEFAGFELSPDNELNSLTLSGCGRGTTLEYIQTHLGDDDGIEFFGGTADLRYAVISHVEDDGLDWDEGWSGRAQFIVITQNAAVGDNGIEADNLGANNDALPRSNPNVWNMTMVGSGNASQVAYAMNLRRGTAGLISNAIVTGFPNGIRVNDDATGAQVEDGALAIRNSIIFDTGEHGTNIEGWDIDAWLADPAHENVLDADPLLADPFNYGNPGLVPASGSPAATVGATPPDDGWFDTSATHAGAFAPGGEDWMSGWTAFPEN
ncbi:MAG: hypothetical protein EA398_12690 [Deltaproteobacteria bacterium]|nr:MAG: hypothetical protein EA398_12690 [Deltaproteobacteria bacterium]